MDICPAETNFSDAKEFARQNMQIFTPTGSNIFHPTNAGQTAPARLQQPLMSFEFAWIALKK